MSHPLDLARGSSVFNKKQENDLEISRAIFHMMAPFAVTLLALKVFGLRFLPTALVIFCIFEKIRLDSEPFHNFAVKWFGFLMSPQERVWPSKLFSVIPMLVGLTLVSPFTSGSNILYLVAALSLGDPMARIMGKTYGKAIKLPWTPDKTAVGFMTIWAVSASLAYLWGFWSEVVVLVSLSIAVAESIGSREHWYTDDNLLVPIFAIWFL